MQKKGPATYDRLSFRNTIRLEAGSKLIDTVNVITEDDREDQDNDPVITNRGRE